MRRYLRLWLSFLKMSWMADFEYRLNISVRVLGEIVWYIAQLSVFEVLYTHTQAINGWDVHAVRVFMGSLFVVDAVYSLLFAENLDHISSLVRRGDLDMYLSKPVNSQFMVSCRKISSSQVINLLMVCAYLGWAISRLERDVSVAQALAYGFLLVCGLVTHYSMRFLVSTLAVILQEAGNLQYLWYQLYRLATRPDPIYPSALRNFVLFVLPIAFIASVPARLLVEGVSPVLLGAAPCLALGLLWLSHKAWEGALRRYASASS
ncbi:MAG: hypothetical protein HC902_07505 [Calothrix sp. SM1_5_4]|nr:hypothetical protein [Calothrix sp. SM1_5_4]